MPPIKRNNARSQEVEKRKLKAASKKKDPDKITDDELEKLFGAVDDKLCKIRSVFQHLMHNLFSGLKTNGQIIICSVPIDYDLKLTFKRNKTNIKIENLQLDFKNNLKEQHYFGRNLEEFDLRAHYDYNGFPTNDPLKVMRTFQKVVSDLNEKYKEQNINRKNINQFIKDIDGLLGLYYINSSINSMSACFQNTYEKFKIEANNYYKHKIFRFINEETKYSYDNGVGKMSGTIFFEYSYSKKYKFTFYFTSDARGASVPSYQMSLAIFEWNQNGWVLLFTDSRPDNIFERDEEKGLIRDSDKRFIISDKMITYAIKFIRNFENIPVGVKLC